jgi:hypothetical protein
MLRFLVASHGLLSRHEAIERIRDGELASVYPLVPGEIMKSGEDTLLQPINLGETLFTNRQRPPRSFRLDELQAALVRLGDGTRSVDSMLSMTGGPGKGMDLNEEAAQSGVMFFIMLFSKGYAVAFERSWKRGMVATPGV